MSFDNGNVDSVAIWSNNCCADLLCFDFSVVTTDDGFGFGGARGHDSFQVGHWLAEVSPWELELRTAAACA